MFYSRRQKNLTKIVCRSSVQRRLPLHRFRRNTFLPFVRFRLANSYLPFLFCHSYAIERWNSKLSWKRTVDVKKTFPRSFAVLPFNGVRTVKWQNVNGKTPVDRLSISRREPQRACATPTFSIGLRYNKEVAKRVLTRYKASTVRKRVAPVATSAETER